jgi:hypothetical protein
MRVLRKQNTSLGEGSEQAVARDVSLFETKTRDLASRGMNLLGVIAMDFFFEDCSDPFQG